MSSETNPWEGGTRHPIKETENRVYSVIGSYRENGGYDALFRFRGDDFEEGEILIGEFDGNKTYIKRCYSDTPPESHRNMDSMPDFISHVRENFHGYIKEYERGAGTQQI